ncbi:MAG: PAS domain S-box protein [Proteobacteria bacterium]|nr:PAS domain S-box protein [Pseudomonadota bacterium]MBU1649998.1 PAS domain S-box protein [Pseudomonadota bacterium]
MPMLFVPSNFKEIQWRKLLPIFLTLTFTLITCLGIFLSSQARKNIHHNIDLIMHEQQMHMILAKTLLHKELDRLSIDLMTFSGTPVILRFFTNPQDPAFRQSVNAGLSNYVKNREDYDQAQIFDNNGRELVRVGKRDKQTVIIPPEELNTKLPDTFLDKTLKLQVRGQTSFSPIELARDKRGEIIHPFHPILHLGTPIFNRQDKKVGVFLFTYKAQQCINIFTQATTHLHDLDEPSHHNLQIVNNKGYWLLAPDKEDEWGFIRDPQRRFDHRFPEMWKTMLEQGQGQIMTADGLITFSTIPLILTKENSKESPAALKTEENKDAAPFWILINQISAKELDRLNAPARRFHLILFWIILMGTLPLLLWIALLLEKKQRDQAQLQAQEQRLTHLNLLLQTIIKLHRLIDQTKEQQELIQECCEILVTSRGYASAWIILLDKNGKVELNAYSGLLLNFDQLNEQINLGKLPPCILECNAQQGIVVIDTPAVFCAECPTAKSYPQTGVMCASLKHESCVFGYLNVLLPIDFIKNQEEKDRFSEIALDIGFGLFNLEQQEKKRQAERALCQSEERLRSITDSAQDAILMMDSQGAISYWNPAAETILGYRADEALGRNLHTLLAPLRYHAAQQQAFPEFLRSGHGNAIGKTVKLSALHKDGREIPVTLSLSSVLQNGSWHAVGILRDMTEYKLMEEQMLQSEKMTIIAGLAAGVSHEINTPLSAILQSLQVIRQSLSPDLARNQEVADHCGLDLTKVQDYFEKREINYFMDGIKDSVIKSAQIIRSLLQFSRPQKMETAPTDLVLLLNQSVELAKNDYNLKKQYDILKVEIIREYTPNLPQVSCVAIEIEEVFINLLKNAVQAMSDQPEPRPKGQIILRALRHGEMIRIEIADNGPGMDEETRLHIFDPFFTTKDIGVGTGLGLSVSYTIIVTKHGGQITVHSVPGQGATFTIDLPINKEKP